jgi:hypothetical protein
MNWEGRRFQYPANGASGELGGEGQVVACEGYAGLGGEV